MAPKRLTFKFDGDVERKEAEDKQGGGYALSKMDNYLLEKKKGGATQLFSV